MKFLLDTCAVSDLFKRVPATIERIKHIQRIDIVLSVITVMEIEYGLKLNPVRELKIRPQWEALINEVRIFPFKKRKQNQLHFYAII